MSTMVSQVKESIIDTVERSGEIVAKEPFKSQSKS